MPAVKQRRGHSTVRGYNAGAYAESPLGTNTPVLDAPVSGPVIDTAYSSISDRKKRLEQIKADMTAAIQQIVDDGSLSDWMEEYAASRRCSRANGMTRWSPYNQLLADLQARVRRSSLTDEERANLPPGTFAMNANAWKKHGRHIRRGEQAIWILRPIMVADEVDDPDHPGQVKRVAKVVGFGAQAEFDACQTDGQDLPDEWVNPPEGYFGSNADVEPDPAALPHMEGVAAKLGYTVHYRATDRQGVLGYTSPSSKRIVIDPALPPAQKASTLAHELGHVACGHTDDLAGYAAHRGRMETEAELTAYMVCAEIGLPRADRNSFSANYIAGWSKSDPGAVEAAFSKASSSVGVIMRDWRPTPGWAEPGPERPHVRG